jgi:predicted GIY-YIG superfamily endonuclease
MGKHGSEFENFDRTMRDLMSVPHDEIKAALDAEKAAKKKQKKRKVKKPSASGRASNGGD